MTLPDAASVQKYAKAAGVLLLVTMFAGFFGEVYAPSKIIVSGDAPATAANIAAHETMFRLGFATYLIEAICDVALSLLFYVLLRPVQKHIALLAAFFGLISTALYAVAELFYFAAWIVVGRAAGLQSFSPQQLQALALLSMKLFGYGGGLFMAFYGIACIIRGYLIFQSGYLPKFIGVLLAIAGFGFILKNFTLVLLPAYSTNAFLFPMFLAGLAMTIWFLVKGVNIARWPPAR